MSRFATITQSTRQHLLIGLILFSPRLTSTRDRKNFDFHIRYQRIINVQSLDIDRLLSTLSPTNFIVVDTLLVML